MVSFINICYLVAAVLFILGIKGMTSPKTAVRGNRMSSIAMLIAVVAALFEHQVVTYWYILIGLLIGSGVGTFLARRVQMTSMPEMVAALNGFGGGASLLVATANYMETTHPGGVAALSGIAPTYEWRVALIASILIGAVTLTGSFVAVGKLMGKLGDTSQVALFKRIVKVCFVILLVGAAAFVYSPLDSDNLLIILVVTCLLLGVMLVMPIGGADMPVVIALLNSYSGIAGAATGFVLMNNGLIITGSLVGASGFILTTIMCKAMNRSLTNVLFGGSMSEQGGMTRDENDAFYEGKVKSASADEVAMNSGNCQESGNCSRVYGLAVAQAQHATRELATQLEDMGAEVKYAIHPVAGRMPGHMNVLLAEAEVPYEQLVEMDVINPEFQQTDVAIVLGANDVTNPAASDDPKQPHLRYADS